MDQIQEDVVSSRSLRFSSPILISTDQVYVWLILTAC